MIFRVNLLVLVMASMSLLVRCTAQTFEAVPMQFQQGLLWVDVVTPNCDRPLRFVVDTGAEVTVLDAAAARELKLKLGSSVKVRGVKATQSGRWLNGWTGKMGEQILPARVLVLDLSSLSKACACRIDGLVGSDFFAGKVVTLDYRNEVLRVTGTRLPRSSVLLDLAASQKALRLKVKVNDSAARWFRLDTGCASSMHWVSSRPPSQGYSSRVAVGLSPMELHEATVAVQIGAHFFPKVLAGMHEKAIFPGEGGLLGNGILARFGSITIDAVHHKLLLGVAPQD